MANFLLRTLIFSITLISLNSTNNWGFFGGVEAPPPGELAKRIVINNGPWLYKGLHLVMQGVALFNKAFMNPGSPFVMVANGQSTANVTLVYMGQIGPEGRYIIDPNVTATDRSNVSMELIDYGKHYNLLNSAKIVFPEWVRCQNESVVSCEFGPTLAQFINVPVTYDSHSKTSTVELGEKDIANAAQNAMCQSPAAGGGGNSSYCGEAAKPPEVNASLPIGEELNQPGESHHITVPQTSDALPSSITPEQAKILAALDIAFAGITLL